MRTWLAAIVLLVPLPAQEPLLPLAPFGDHMVLPRWSLVPIRGIARPGATVTVTGSWQQTATGVAGADGRFAVPLHTGAAGGPFEVSLQSDHGLVVLRDVLVGDVWLASGQSNMEMAAAPDPTGAGMLDYERELAAADLPTLRFFTVQRATAGTPRGEVHGYWQVVTPATAGRCSAVAFCFGRELVRAGKGPQGLVVSAWGGTVAEAWTPAARLAEFPEFGPELQALADHDGEGFAEAQARFWAKVPERPVTNGQFVTMPDRWSRGALRDFDGVAFYAAKLELPAELLGKDLQLELGAIDDCDTVYVNGERVGGHERDGAWATPRRYAVPAQSAPELQLLVRVLDTGGEGGFTADGETMCLTLASGDGPRVPLPGNWVRSKGPALAELPPWPRDPSGNPNRPSVLWNGMLAGLAPFPFTGAIWYQGESNIGRAEQYARLLPTMVQAWRQAFGTRLPFYCVQIAPFGYGHDGAKTAALRLAQAAVLALPNTGMVVTLDCGDARDIHPRDKQTVGKRLARWALADHYGDAVAAAGPQPGPGEVVGAAVRIPFTATTPLRLANGGAGFEVAGEDGSFHPATARLEGAVVVLQAAAVAAPQRWRYAHGNVPGWSVVDSEGLPAAPFEQARR